jgi:hypothetical protein
MRPRLASIPALLAVSAVLLTACDPNASTPEVRSSPTPSSAAVPTASPTSPPPETPSATATSTVDVAEATAGGIVTAGGVLTVDPPPASLVAGWARHQLYELSFVVPASPDKLSFADNPGAYSVYNWNQGDTFDPEPLLHMSVASSATDGRATPPMESMPGTESVSELDLPGADGAWLTVERAPADPRLPGAYRSYFVTINTAARMYMLYIGVPRTDEGAQAAKEAIASLHLTTG